MTVKSRLKRLEQAVSTPVTPALPDGIPVIYHGTDGEHKYRNAAKARAAGVPPCDDPNVICIFVPDEEPAESGENRQ